MNLKNGEAEEGLLSPREEQELLRKIRTGDQSSRRRVILANVGLVRKMAHRYRHCGIPLDDLIHEGHLGLIHAIDRFDPSAGNRLSTYAVWWIRHFIRNAIASQSRAFSLPLHILQNLHRLHSESDRWRREHHCEPTPEQLARATGFSPTKVRTLRLVSGGTVALEEAAGDDEESLSWLEKIPDGNQPTPLDQLMRQSLVVDLKRWMSTLSPRERDILRWHYGLEGTAPLSFEEISQRCNLTRERVRQIEKEALKKLRRLV